MDNSNLVVGKVKSIKRTYGFINYDKKDVFYHNSNVIGQSKLVTGDMVEFELRPSDKKKDSFEAHNIIIKEKAKRKFPKYIGKLSKLKYGKKNNFEIITDIYPISSVKVNTNSSSHYIEGSIVLFDITTHQQNEYGQSRWGNRYKKLVKIKTAINITILKDLTLTKELEDFFLKHIEGVIEKVSGKRHIFEPVKFLLRIISSHENLIPIKSNFVEVISKQLSSTELIKLWLDKLIDHFNYSVLKNYVLEMPLYENHKVEEVFDRIDNPIIFNKLFTEIISKIEEFEQSCEHTIALRSRLIITLLKKTIDEAEKNAIIVDIRKRIANKFLFPFWIEGVIKLEVCEILEFIDQFEQINDISKSELLVIALKTINEGKDKDNLIIAIKKQISTESLYALWLNKNKGFENNESVIEVITELKYGTPTILKEYSNIDLSQIFSKINNDDQKQVLISVIKKLEKSHSNNSEINKVLVKLKNTESINKKILFEFINELYISCDYVRKVELKIDGVIENDLSQNELYNF